MSKDVLLSMLRQGNNGQEILSILDAIVSDSVDSVDLNEPTSEEIEF
jgi:hypothetical protein